MLKYPDINPIAIDFGIIKIRWYGIAYVVGILLAWWMLHRRSKTIYRIWDKEEVADLIFYTTLGIILGGRLGSVLFYNLPYYFHHPLQIIMINRGGMSFHGGLIGVCIALWVYGKKHNRNFFTITDFVAPAAPIGLFFGRLANFVNGELWGRPTDLPWGMVFPRADNQPRHPSQLYEAFLEGIVLFIIMWAYSRKPKPVMAVSGLFLACYGLFRGSVEWVRQPDIQLGFLYGGWLTMGMLLSFPMFVIGIVLLVMAYRRDRREPREGQ